MKRRSFLLLPFAVGITSYLGDGIRKASGDPITFFNVLSLFNVTVGLYKKFVVEPAKNAMYANIADSLDNLEQLQNEFLSELADIEVLISTELRAAFYNEDLHQLKSLLADYNARRIGGSSTGVWLNHAISRASILVEKISWYGLPALPAYYVAACLQLTLYLERGVNLSTASRILEAIEPKLQGWMNNTLIPLHKQYADKLSLFTQHLSNKHTFLLGEGYTTNAKKKYIYREKLMFSGLDHSATLLFERLPRNKSVKSDFRNSRYQRSGTRLFYWKTEKHWNSLSGKECPHGTGPYNGAKTYPSPDDMLSKLAKNANKAEACIRTAYQKDLDSYKSFRRTVARLAELINAMQETIDNVASTHEVLSKAVSSGRGNEVIVT